MTRNFSVTKQQKITIQKFCALFASIAVLVVMLKGVATYQSAIEFADIGLETVVRENLEKPDGLISRSQLLQITHLDARGRGIVHLDGIEHLRRLVVLNLEDNRVNSLAPLRNLNRLKELNLRNNRITDLESVDFGALHSLQLRSLSLRHNVVRSRDGSQSRLSDLSLLAPLTSLETLHLRDNHIVDLAPLSGMVNLRTLNLRENLITSIQPLGNLTELRKLNLRENSIRDITPLASLETLTYLNIHSNFNIHCFAPLARLVRLETLIMRNTPLGGQVGVLGRMTSLKRLNVRSCDIADISAMTSLMAAGALQDGPIAGAQGTSLDIRDNPVDWDYFVHHPESCAFWLNIRNRRPFFVPPACQIAPPTFSHQGGFHPEAFALTLSHPDPDAIIVFTLDGSDPDIANLEGTTYVYKNQYPQNPGDPVGEFLEQSYQSHVYQGPIPIYDRSSEPDKLARISSTAHANPDYFPSSPVRKATVVRAVAQNNNGDSSTIRTHTYFMEDERFKYNIPIISLSTTESNLFDFREGIYTAGMDFELWRSNNPEEKYNPWRDSNFHRRGSQWEYPANFEVFADIFDHAIVNQQTGIRIHGNTSRAFPLKNLRIYARNKYDEEYNISHELFENFHVNDSNQFRRLILRTGNRYINDVVSHKIFQPVYAGGNRTIPAVVFLNGEYWGIASIMDRFDQYHLAYNYGFNKNNLIILNTDREVRHGKPEDLQTFNEMYTFAVENDLSIEKNYNSISKMLDIESYVDYLVINIYLGKCDWWGNFHYGFWRVREPNDLPYGDGKWRTYTWDFDAVWRRHPICHYVDDLNYLQPAVSGWVVPPEERIGHPRSRSSMLPFLLKSSSFKNYFINRFADHINTTFLPSRIERIIREEHSIIEHYIPEFVHRWGSSIAPDSHVKGFIANAQQRPSVMRQHIMEEFNIDGQVSVTLDVSDVSGGHIRINTVDIAPGTPGIGSPPYPWTGVYFSGIPIELKAIPAHGHCFAGWIVSEGKPGKGASTLSPPSITLTQDSDITLTAHFQVANTRTKPHHEKTTGHIFNTCP